MASLLALRCKDNTSMYWIDTTRLSFCSIQPCKQVCLSGRTANTLHHRARSLLVARQLSSVIRMPNVKMKWFCKGRHSSRLRSMTSIVGAVSYNSSESCDIYPASEDGEGGQFNDHYIGRLTAWSKGNTSIMYPSGTDSR